MLLVLVTGQYLPPTYVVFARCFFLLGEMRRSSCGCQNLVKHRVSHFLPPLKNLAVCINTTVVVSQVFMLLSVYYSCHSCAKKRIYRHDGVNEKRIHKPMRTFI